MTAIVFDGRYICADSLCVDDRETVTLVSKLFRLGNMISGGAGSLTTYMLVIEYVVAWMVEKQLPSLTNPAYVINAPGLNWADFDAASIVIFNAPCRFQYAVTLRGSNIILTREDLQPTVLGTAAARYNARRILANELCKASLDVLVDIRLVPAFQAMQALAVDSGRDRNADQYIAGPFTVVDTDTQADEPAAYKSLNADGYRFVSTNLADELLLYLAPQLLPPAPQPQQ